MKKIIMFFLLLAFSFFAFSQKAWAAACSENLFQVTITPNPPIPETSSQVDIVVSPLQDAFNPNRTYKIDLSLAGTPMYAESGLSVANKTLRITITPQEFKDLFYYSVFFEDGYDLKVFAEPNDLICSGIKIPKLKPSCSLRASWNQDFSIKVDVSGYTGRDTQGSYGPHVAIQRQTGCLPILGCGIVPFSITISSGKGSVQIPKIGDPTGTKYKIVLTTARNMSGESCSTEITKPLTPPTPPPPGTTPLPTPTSCDPCGLCKGATPPPGYEKCRACVIDQTTLGKPGAWTALGCIDTEPSGFVAWLLQRVIGIAGGIAFLLILYGGFQILTSTGDPEKLTSGKDIIVSAIAGLLMIVFSVLLLRIIGYDILQIPGFTK